jgi:diacylglycerol kinase (ATP)
MVSGIMRQLGRIRDRAQRSWEGVVHVLRTEGSLHQWLWANAASASLAVLLPLSPGERAAILMGGVLVLALECLNTAVERVVDDVSESRRPRAKQAKDAGSAAVALGGVAVGVAWVAALARMMLDTPA